MSGAGRVTQLRRRHDAFGFGEGSESYDFSCPHFEVGRLCGAAAHCPSVGRLNIAGAASMRNAIRGVRRYADKMWRGHDRPDRDGKSAGGLDSRRRFGIFIFLLAMGNFSGFVSDNLV
jgi:hypothetical protein